MCSHVLILHGGRKVAGGTLAEIVQQFHDPLAADAPPDLEEIFFRATGQGGCFRTAGAGVEAPPLPPSGR